jgi:hypothetical protein
VALTRYTRDPDGALTFYDDATGETLRTTGPAAEQRAVELDAQTPMALGGLPPVPPKPEPQLLAARTPSAAARVDAAGDAGAAAVMQAGRPRQPPAPRGAPKPVDLGEFDAQAAPIELTEAELADTSTPVPRRGTTAAPLPIDRATGKPIDPRTGKPAEMTSGDRAVVAAATGAPPTTPDGRAIHFPGAPAEGQPPEGPKQLIESGQTTVTSGSSSGTSSTSSYQRSMGPDPATVAALEKAQREEARARAEIVNLQARASVEIAQQRDDMAQREAAWATEQRLIEDETQKRLAPINASMMKAVDDVRAAKVDPNRIWKDGGVGRQIGAAIAVAFGAIAQGMKGGRNDAWDVIEAAEKQDVQLQLQDIEKKRGDIAMLAQVGREVRAQGADTRTAELAMHITALESIKHRIESIAARADAAIGGDGNSLKMAPLLKEAEIRIAAYKAEMSERQRGQVSGQVTKQSQSQTQVSKMHVDREMVDAPGDPNDDKEQIFFNGQYFRMGGYVKPEEAAKYRDKFVQLDVMKMNLRKLKELRKEVGQRFYEDARYQAIADQVSAARSQLQGMGVLGVEEGKRYIAWLTNLRAGDDVLDQMDDFTDRVAGGVLNQVKARPIGQSGGSSGVTVVGRSGKTPGGKKKLWPTRPPHRRPSRRSLRTSSGSMTGTSTSTWSRPRRPLRACVVASTAWPMVTSSPSRRLETRPERSTPQRPSTRCRVTSSAQPRSASFRTSGTGTSTAAASLTRRLPWARVSPRAWGWGSVTPLSSAWRAPSGERITSVTSSVTKTATFLATAPPAR